MLAEFSGFRWHVFSAGYECTDRNVRGKNLRIVAPRWLEDDSLDESNLIARYPLEEEPGLYRVFADLELTEEAILEFANAWGPLENAHELESDEIEDRMVAWTVDPVESWFMQIRTMRALVELWDVLKGARAKKLSEVIEVEKFEGNWSWDVLIVFKGCPDLKWSSVFRERDWPGFSEDLEMGGTRELARICLLEIVNDSIWGSCSPWLKMGDKLEEVTMCFTPHNLKAALWLMFAQEILGEKNLKQCLYCKRYFEASKETNERRQRSDKKYCSPKCRGAAFRERVEKPPTEEGRNVDGR